MNLPKALTPAPTAEHAPTNNTTGAAPVRVAPAATPPITNPTPPVPPRAAPILATFS